MKYKACKFFGGQTDLRDDRYVVFCKRINGYVWVQACRGCSLF